MDNDFELSKTDLISLQYSFSIVTLYNAVKNNQVEEEFLVNYVKNLLQDPKVAVELDNPSRVCNRIIDDLVSYITATVLFFSEVEGVERPYVSVNSDKKYPVHISFITGDIIKFHTELVKMSNSNLDFSTFYRLSKEDLIQELNNSIGVLSLERDQVDAILCIARAALNLLEKEASYKKMSVEERLQELTSKMAIELNNLS